MTAVTHRHKPPSSAPFRGLSFLVACLGLLVVAPSLSAQGYFQFQHGGGPTRVGSADGPLAEGNIVSQILAGVDELSLTPVDIPKPNHLGIITVRNIVEVPFLQTQETAYVRYAAWDASIWGMNYREVPPYAVGISSLSTVFLYQKDRDAYLTPIFQGAVIVPLSVPEPSTYWLLAFGMGLVGVMPRTTSRHRGNQ